MNKLVHNWFMVKNRFNLVHGSADKLVVQGATLAPLENNWWFITVSFSQYVPWAATPPGRRTIKPLSFYHGTWWLLMVDDYLIAMVSCYHWSLISLRLWTEISHDLASVEHYRSASTTITMINHQQPFSTHQKDINNRNKHHETSTTMNIHNIF